VFYRVNLGLAAEIKPTVQDRVSNGLDESKDLLQNKVQALSYPDNLRPRKWNRMSSKADDGE
jgi:hypothetical protein